MSEPTIDDMLLWLDAVVGVSQHPIRHGSWVLTDVSKKANESMSSAIRAVLLHHKHNLVSVNQVIELEVIRAFVERVKKRYRDEGTTQGLTSMLDELAAMEKEADR